MRFKYCSVVVGYMVLVALTLLANFFALRAEAKTADPPIEGSMVKFVASDPPIPVPDTPFIGVDGETIKLADYKGRLVLLNFWATWCAPCIRELPSIESLASSVNDPRFTVQLVSIDRGGAKVHKPFLENLGITGIASASDPRARLLRAVKGPGVPVTVLINSEGLMVGRLIGDAHWDSPAARLLIKFYLDQG